MKKLIVFWLVLMASTLCGATDPNDLFYAGRDTPSTFAGINVTEIHVWDFYNTSVASYQFYNASIITLPQMAQIERNLIPGSKLHYTVYTTARTNQTLTSFSNTLAVYDKDESLDLLINLNSEGLPMVLKLKNEEIESYIENYPDSIQGLTFEKLVSMVDYAYAFNNSGWAKVVYNTTSKRFDVKEKCTDFNLGLDIIQTIKINSISLQNFRLNNSLSCGLPSELKQMQPGYYVLVALSVNDYGNPTFKLVVPFVVLNGTSQNNKPSVSNVESGKDFQVNFGYEFDASFAVLVKNVTYNGSFKMDLTKPIANSFKVNLTYGSEPLTSVKILDKDLNFYAPEKFVRAVFNNSDTQQNISTTGLEIGDYALYVVTFGDQLEPKFIGKLSVSILPKNATLIIKSTPSEAEVYINGILKGTTNLTLSLPPGTYDLRITKSGYQDYNTTITLTAGETKTIDVVLNPIPTTTPRPPVGGGGGGGGGGGVIPGVPIYMSDYIKLKANEENEFIFPQSAFWETNLYSITFISSNDVTLRFRVEKLKEWPSIPRPPWGIVAFLFTIDLTLSAPTELKGEIVYGVERKFIQENLFDPDNVVVVLYRYDGENWIRYDATFVSTDGKYNYYKASVPTFSGYFATVIEALPPTVTPGEIVAEKPPETTPSTPAPPISLEFYMLIFLLVAIGAILATIAYILWKTK
ncbi:MAG: PEGA domain-containing protein [Archaeoglobaceae archaeon]